MAVNTAGDTSGDTHLSTLKVAATYIGTVVGAGFATGQEILQFFGFHGLNGVWGVLLSTTLFVVYGGMVLLLGRRLQASSHLEVVREAGGKWVGTLIDAVISFFLVGALTAMAAGAGAVFDEQFGVSATAGSVVMIALSIATVLFGLSGVISAITFVVPFLIAAVFAVSLFTIFTQPIHWGYADIGRAAIGFWPVSAIAYVSFNLVLATPVLAPMGTLSDESTLRKGALLGGLGLGLGALAIQLSVLTQVPEAAEWDIPMIYISGQVFEVLPLLYSAVLLAEVYTTAVSSLYGFSARFTEPESSTFRIVAISTGVVAFFGSLIGFSELVATLYSGVGYAGFILIVALTIAYFKDRGKAGA